MASPKLSRRKLLAFAPACLVIGVTAFVASGASLIPGAAATSIGVEGTISSTLTTNPTAGGGGGATGCAGETLAGNFQSALQQSDGCEVSFSSNNGNGAQVMIQNATPAEANFFCADPDDAGPQTRSCAVGTNVVNDVTGTAQAIAADSDKFGVALMTVGGAGSSLSTVAGAGVGGVLAGTGTIMPTDAVWAEIPDHNATVPSPTATQLCRLGQPNVTTSTCQFKFGGAGAGTGTQGAGRYTGTLEVVATLL